MRQYTPKVGDLVKLRRIEYYTTLRQEASELATWSWLKVLEIGSGEEPTVRVQHYDAGVTGLVFNVQPSWIDPPLGWKPQYTITVSTQHQFREQTPEQMVQIIRTDWFKRGIAVWISHEIGSSPDYAYTPLTDSKVQAPGHWKYTANPVEIVSPSDCADVFRIVLVEEFAPNLPPSKQRKERADAMAALRDLGYALERFDGETWAMKETQVYPEYREPVDTPARS